MYDKIFMYVTSQLQAHVLGYNAIVAAILRTAQEAQR